MVDAVLERVGLRANFRIYILTCRRSPADPDGVPDRLDQHDVLSDDLDARRSSPVKKRMHVAPGGRRLSSNASASVITAPMRRTARPTSS